MPLNLFWMPGPNEWEGEDVRVAPNFRDTFEPLEIFADFPVRHLLPPPPGISTLLPALLLSQVMDVPQSNPSAAAVPQPARKKSGDANEQRRNTSQLLHCPSFRHKVRRPEYKRGWILLYICKNAMRTIRHLGTISGTWVQFLTHLPLRGKKTKSGLCSVLPL